MACPFPRTRCTTRRRPQPRQWRSRRTTSRSTACASTSRSSRSPSQARTTTSASTTRAHRAAGARDSFARWRTARRSTIPTSTRRALATATRTSMKSSYRPRAPMSRCTPSGANTRTRRHASRLWSTARSCATCAGSSSAIRSSSRRRRRRSRARWCSPSARLCAASTCCARMATRTCATSTAGASSRTPNGFGTIRPICFVNTLSSNSRPCIWRVTRSPRLSSYVRPC